MENIDTIMDLNQVNDILSNLSIPENAKEFIRGEFVKTYDLIEEYTYTRQFNPEVLIGSEGRIAYGQSHEYPWDELENLGLSGEKLEEVYNMFFEE